MSLRENGVNKAFYYLKFSLHNVGVSIFRFFFLNREKQGSLPSFQITAQTSVLYLAYVTDFPVTERLVCF